MRRAGQKALVKVVFGVSVFSWQTYMHLIAAFTAAGGIRQLSESTTGPTAEVQLNQSVNSGPFVAIVNGGQRIRVGRSFKTHATEHGRRDGALGILYPDGEIS